MEPQLQYGNQKVFKPIKRVDIINVQRNSKLGLKKNGRIKLVLKIKLKLWITANKSETNYNKMH